jgi:hypothetical protein
MVDPAPQEEAAPPSKWRELSQIPEERSEQRKSVAGEADALLAMLDGAVQQIPPGKPLQPGERAMLETPLQETIYKYGANVDPAVTLGIAVLAIGYMRWQDYKKAEKAIAPPPPKG